MAISAKRANQIFRGSLRRDGAVALVAFQKLVTSLSRSYRGVWPPGVRQHLEAFRREFFWFVDKHTG
jgi:hypothetical protein